MAMVIMKPGMEWPGSDNGAKAQARSRMSKDREGDGGNINVSMTWPRVYIRET